MNVKQALAAYAQSEKVKSGLIWICHISDQVDATEGAAKKQTVNIVRNPCPLGCRRIRSGRKDYR
jgi:hypothetical protein